MEDRRHALLDNKTVSGIRRLVGLDDDGGIVNLAAVERLDDFWDILAGPHRLTGAEKSAIRACRERFGHYDPTSIQQICFLEDRDTPAVEEAPVAMSQRDAFWNRYLKTWKAA